MALIRSINKPRAIASCQRQVGESIVVGKLAVTPSQIERMARDGIAVSVPNANNFFSEPDAEGWNIDPAFARDSDRNSVWESSQLAKNRLLTARRKDKEKYG